MHAHDQECIALSVLAIGTLVVLYYMCTWFADQVHRARLEGLRDDCIRLGETFTEGAFSDYGPGDDLVELGSTFAEKLSQDRDLDEIQGWYDEEVKDLLEVHRLADYLLKSAKRHGKKSRYYSGWVKEKYHRELREYVRRALLDECHDLLDSAEEKFPQVFSDLKKIDKAERKLDELTEASADTTSRWIPLVNTLLSVPKWAKFYALPVDALIQFGYPGADDIDEARKIFKKYGKNGKLELLHTQLVLVKTISSAIEHIKENIKRLDGEMNTFLELQDTVTDNDFYNAMRCKPERYESDDLHHKALTELAEWAIPKAFGAVVARLAPSAQQPQLDQFLADIALWEAILKKDLSETSEFVSTLTVELETIERIQGTIEDLLRRDVSQEEIEDVLQSNRRARDAEYELDNLRNKPTGGNSELSGETYHAHGFGTTGKPRR